MVLQFHIEHSKTSNLLLRLSQTYMLWFVSEENSAKKGGVYQK